MKKIIITILALVFCISVTESKDLDSKKLPSLLGSNNVGTEFFLTFHPSWPSGGDSDFIKIYIASAVETEVRLEVPGKEYLKIQNTVPNDIIEFILPPSVAQPYLKNDTEKPKPAVVSSGNAIHITSKAPIICYGVIRYKYTSDGYLAIPVSGLGRKYIVASWPDPTGGKTGHQFLSSYTSVVSAYDKTKVKLVYGGGVHTETADGKHPGDTDLFNMNSADVLTIGTVSKHGDLTGTVISSSKLIGVISGNFCAFVPLGVMACDVLIEMEIPTSEWGKEYHVTPIKTRKKNSIIRIFAAENNTQIFKNGQPIGFISEAGGIKGDGWLSLRADDGTPAPLVFSADKPISITQYNPGQNDDGVQNDPFQMVLSPIAQYQKEIIFNTPGIRGGQGFKDNYINLVYVANDDNTLPDDLLFGIAKDGVMEWKQLNQNDSDPGQKFEYKINGENYFCKTIDLPGDGVYSFKASKPFAAYSYGSSAYDSYGFPASISTSDISADNAGTPDAEKPIATVHESDLCGYAEGTFEDMPNDNNIRSNLALIYLDSELSYNYKFEFNSFVPGDDRKTNWKLEPIDEDMEAHAVVKCFDRRGNVCEFVLGYKPTGIIASEDDIDFGLVMYGEEVEKSFTLTNSSEKLSYDLSTMFVELKEQGFEVLNKNMPSVLKPLEEYKINVRFKAQNIGESKNKFVINNSCYSENVIFKAVAGAPVINVQNMSFAVQELNSSESLMLSLSNNGSYDLTISDLKFRDNQIDFVIPDDLLELSENPIVLKPGETHISTIKFIPEKIGFVSDTLEFISNSISVDGAAIKNTAVISGVGRVSSSVSEEQFAKLFSLNFDTDSKNLTIRNKQSANINLITIIDINGRIVHKITSPGNNSKYQINLANLASGTYFVNITSASGDGMLKFIVR